MPRLSPERAALKRRQIMDAALAAFAERGFHDATMQDVVRESGLSPGSIYSHFTSKEEILHAVVEARHRADAAILEHAFDAKTLDEALTMLADAFLPSPARHEDRLWRRLAVQLWGESLHDAALLKVVRDGVDRPVQMLMDLLRKAQRRGELARHLAPEPTARLLIAAFQGIVLQQTWDETVDAAACVRVLRQLLAMAPR
ncbi:MAG TPA: TetR/AcrR family transcriptional regulator [Stellaceae bacterium]|nr:TetR/AcrR family transcriptional regulator [Stellaceae bacterium]